MSCEALRARRNHGVWLSRMLAIGFLLQGCATIHELSLADLAALDNPPSAVRDRVEVSLPRVVAWVAQVEQDLAPTGRPLSDDEARAAVALGVRDASRVRVLVREEFPMPTDAELLAQVKRYGLGSRNEGGRCNGYLILLKPKIAKNPAVLRHELVHVAQQDRLGREQFLRRYLTELELVGYARAPLEREAYEKQKGAR